MRSVATILFILMTSACAQSEGKGEALNAGDAGPSDNATQTDADADADSDADVDADSDADADTDADSDADVDIDETQRTGDFAGLLDTTYVYNGSLGSWDDHCLGDVTFTVDESMVLAGEGDCTFTAWEMGFWIEGQQTGTLVEGLLISDNSLGRAETPFSGTRSADGFNLSFDELHAADGEEVQLIGTITASMVQ